MLNGGKLWRQFVDYFCQQQTLIAVGAFVPLIFYLGNHTCPFSNIFLIINK